MDSGNASIDSPPSFNGSYDSASSIRERDETYNSLQDKLKVLLKIQKRNEKLKQYVEEAKKKSEQHLNYIKELQEQLNEIVSSLNLQPDSSLSSILDKIKTMNENEAIFLEISDIVDISNSTDKKSIISIIKEDTLFKRSISEILGKNKSTDELVNEIKQLKKSKLDADAALNELGTNNFEYLIENQKQAEKQQRQICTLLGVKSETERCLRHKSIISTIKDLKNKPSEILTDLGQLLSPNFTEKIEDPQDIKNMINELKQKVQKLSSELQNDKNGLSQFHFQSVDEVTTIISELLTMLNIKSPSMIQAEISKVFTENKELKTSIKSTTEELQKMKSKLKTKEDECEENQTKISDFLEKYKKIESEKSSLQNSIKDKNDEIDSLKSLLQTEKGNIKLKFDELSEQISTLKSKNEELITNHNEKEMKNQELSTELEHLHEELESTKKSLKEQISLRDELSNQLEQTKSDLSFQIKTANDEKDQQIEKHNYDIKEKDKQLKKLLEEFNDIQKILKIQESDQIRPQILKILNEQEDLKQTNNYLSKERQNIAKILNISNENSISETISDLVETQAEQKAENQDLVQKIAAIASFLNIPESQTATLATIQKTIRNLQKDFETTQNEKTKLKSENDSLNQKYEVLLDTQNEIQKSLNSTTFKSSNELIKAVSDNENLISKSCQKLKVNKDELFDKIKLYDDIISELCQELNTDESNLVKLVGSQKKSIGKAAQILNTSGSSIEKAIEDNNELINNICQKMNCSREEIVDNIDKNNHLLKELQKITNCERVDQIPSEITTLQSDLEKSKQQMKEVMNKLHINSFDKSGSTLSSLQKEAEKASSYEKKTDEITSLLKIENGKSLDDVKHSIQNLMGENKRLNDTMSRIQTIMNSTDILNSITLMSTIFNSIQKMLPKNTDLHDIPTIIGHYQSDSESYKKIQQLFSSTDPISEIASMQKEMNEIYSIFDLKKFEDPIEIIQRNNKFVKTVFEIDNEPQPSSSRSGRKSRNIDTNINSIDTNELINSVRKTYDEQREIMTLLNTDSALKGVKRLIDQREEISQLINLNPDEEATARIQKVVGLKNNLSNLLDVDEESDILSSIQKQKQTNKELFSILNVDDTKQLLSKATELANVERLLKKVCPEETDLKEVIHKIEKEKKLMLDIITKISSIVNSGSSENSSPASSVSSHSSNSDKSKSLNHKQIVKKVEKLAKIKNEICELLNCSENSILEQIRTMKDDLDSLNEIFNSEVNGSGQSKLIQSAKNDKQILKSLVRAVDVSQYSEILPKVNSYQNEIEELHEKLDQTEKFKSKLNKIFETSQINSPSSIEKKAEEFKTRSNQFIDLLSLLNCDEDEVKSMISDLLSITNCSSINDVLNFIDSLKEKVEKMSSKIQKDNTLLSEFLSDGDSVNSDNLVQVTVSKMKHKNYSLQEKLLKFDKEMNKHANFIKNTSNIHYSIDEMASIFKAHEDQLKKMKSLFSSNGYSNGVQETFQKVEQMHHKLKETTNELSKSQQLISQKNFEISNILSACNVSSPEFVIDIVNSLKKQIVELNREVAELKTCKTVEESFRLLENKEKQDFAAIATKLNEINNLLHALLTLIETGKNQKAEMKKLIEGALLESINLRETLEANEEKWILFGSKKKIMRKSTISDEVRIKKKELVDKKRKADKAEATVYSQQKIQQNKSQQIQHKPPHTLL
ncbi:hypothetical protein M9Y10_035674 [Tritrichomonas musculus]|uniref:Viral A-type inclusion protein n=1 Tax=Tritrichomonas musculus TaxID=1915356 RepID=A0ABR2GWH0_9EUKA